MSREILFKAKRTDTGEWVKGAYSRFYENSGKLLHMIFVNYENEKRSQPVDIDPSTLCQYTGLTDKNGKKIFDGDIVKFLGNIGTVKFECGCFGITFNYTIDWEKIESNICPITGCDNALHTCENDNFISLWEIYWNFNDEGNSVYTVEVIGNIFDNPKLLKEGAE